MTLQGDGAGRRILVLSAQGLGTTSESQKSLSSEAPFKGVLVQTPAMTGASCTRSGSGEEGGVARSQPRALYHISYGQQISGSVWSLLILVRDWRENTCDNCVPWLSLDGKAIGFLWKQPWD